MLLRGGERRFDCLLCGASERGGFSLPLTLAATSAKRRADLQRNDWIIPAREGMLLMDRADLQTED